MAQGSYKFRKHGEISDAVAPEAMPGAKAGNPLLDEPFRKGEFKSQYLLIKYDKSDPNYKKDLAIVRSSKQGVILELDTPKILYQIVEVDALQKEKYRGLRQRRFSSDSKGLLLRQLFGELESKLAD
jgi:hypothetical protein